MTDKIYNHTEMTEITQYNVENADTFMGWKKYSPVFHWLQPKPGGVTEYHEGYVEIGWPADTPRDTEDYDDLILAQSWQERPVHPDAILVSPATWFVKANDDASDLQLTATVTPSWSEFPIEWSSSDTTKATVSSTWKVHWLAVWENIKITARSWAVEDFATIEVRKVEITSISLNKSETSLVKDETETLTVTYNPTNVTNKWVTWSSSDNTKVSVNDWVITALAAAEWIVITATATDDNTKTATCTVTVTEPVTEPETPSEEPGE